VTHHVRSHNQALDLDIGGRDVNADWKLIYLLVEFRHAQVAGREALPRNTRSDSQV
jgi:hypothetical protein